ncbi:MAG TPA: S1/P1 Nuclease [Caulobacteraceae bacterium]|nr:S1/P1 Nuclease [Caulobacteraceae bacterium]
MRLAAIASAALLALAPAQALAWGATGHRIVGVLGAEALPDEVPAFLRSPGVATEIGELAREPDRSKSAGRIHDSDRDAAHFIDVDDAGLVMGGPPLSAMPPTRADYETALQAAGSNSWKAGYLYYSLIDGWQQLVKDFAYWRALDAAERLASDPERRAWFAADRARRESLLIRDLGAWAHYVGDASQPLHVSVHFNGWGPYPNPEGYSTARVHAPLEGAFVHDNVHIDAVRRRMPAFYSCGCSIERRTTNYLTETHGLVERLYQLEKRGAFANGDPRGRDFNEMVLAAAASELRDLVVEAWRASAGITVGWPETKVADIEAGRIDPYEIFYGID